MVRQLGIGGLEVKLPSVKLGKIVEGSCCSWFVNEIRNTLLLYIGEDVELGLCQLVVDLGRMRFGCGNLGWIWVGGRCALGSWMWDGKTCKQMKEELNVERYFLMYKDNLVKCLILDRAFLLKSNYCLYLSNWIHCKSGIWLLLY